MLLLDEAFGDLDRVEGRTLAEIVARQEQAESMLAVSSPDATDIGRIDTGCVERRRDVHQHDTIGIGEEAAARRG